MVEEFHRLDEHCQVCRKVPLLKKRWRRLLRVIVGCVVVAAGRRLLYK